MVHEGCNESKGRLQAMASLVEKDDQAMTQSKNWTLLQACHYERDRLKAINAEFLEALVSAALWCEHNGCGVGRTAEMPWLQDARATISKATQG